MPALKPSLPWKDCSAPVYRKTVLSSFIFHADSHIEPILQRYQQNRTRKNPLVESNTEAVVTFLTKGKKGLKACSNIPVRNFRLFVAVNLPGECPGTSKS